MKIKLLSIHKTECHYDEYPRTEKRIVMVYQEPMTHDEAIAAYVEKAIATHNKLRQVQFQAGKAVDAVYPNAEAWLRANDVTRYCFFSEEWEVVSKNPEIQVTQPNL